MKVEVRINRKSVMGIVEGISVIIAKHSGGTPTFDQLWASDAESPKLDIYYREAIGDLERYLTEYIGESSAQMDLQANGNVINTPNWTYQDLLNACEYRGKGYYGVTYEQNKIIAILSRCYTGNLDDQTVYGYGTGARYVTGQKDKVGMDTTSTNSGPNKTWGLEGWIACNWEVMDNVGVNITTFKDWKAALRPDNGNTNVTNDTMHVYDPRTDTERVVKWLNSSGYCIARLRHGRYCDIAASSCNTDNSKWNTRYAAVQWYNRTGGRVVGRASVNASANGGFVYAYANNASSYSWTNGGARLAYCGAFDNESDIDEEA